MALGSSVQREKERHFKRGNNYHREKSLFAKRDSIVSFFPLLSPKDDLFHVLLKIYLSGVWVFNIAVSEKQVSKGNSSC